MCTLPEGRKRPALRGFVGGRCVLGCTSLYHSAIFERAHPGENAAKTPPNAAHSVVGVSTPTCLDKSAHSASYGATASSLPVSIKFPSLMFFDSQIIPTDT